MKEAFLSHCSNLVKTLCSGNFTCDVCGREVFEGERICKNCLNSLPRIERYCPRCGRGVSEEGYCLDCKDKPPLFDLGRSAFLHEGQIARLVVRFKRGQKYLVQTLADLLEPLLSAFPNADCLTFVPMTEKAQRARGYNQSQLLCEELSRRSGLPLLPPARKIRETDPQKFLGRKERLKNLKGCFSLTKKQEAAGKRIILIDDTMTTGATLSELSALYHGAGAEKVYALTVTSVQFQRKMEKKRGLGQRRPR